MKIAWCFTRLVVSASLLCAAGCHQDTGLTKAKSESSLKMCLQEPDVGVRLYYNPLVNGEGTAHQPCIFLPVSSEDPRLGTRPAWILYVSFADVRKVLEYLDSQEFAWKESGAPTPIVVDAFDLPQPQHDALQIVVTCPHGSAEVQVPQARICSFVSGLSKVLTDPKSRDRFAFYERTIYCDSEAGGRD